MIKYNELEHGEYYVHENNNIFIWGEGDSSYYLGNDKTSYKKGKGNFRDAKRLATLEEIQ